MISWYWPLSVDNLASAAFLMKLNLFCESEYLVSTTFLHSAYQISFSQEYVINTIINCPKKLPYKVTFLGADRGINPPTKCEKLAMNQL